MSASRPADCARGCAVGTVTVGLTVAAHGLAGGGYPNGTAFTLLVAVCMMIGVAAASVRIPVAIAVLGLLGFGQFAGHFVLSTLTGASHTHGSSPLGGWSMFAAHTLATALSAILIVIAERLYAVVSNTVRIVLDSATPTPTTRRRPALANQTTRPLFGARLRGALSRRGPPLTA